MNKKEFLDALKSNLRGISNDELIDILYDYEEHFNIGLERGKTEEEIAKELGDPRTIAKSYKASQSIEIAKNNPTPSNIIKAVVATMALGFFNLVFVLGPFMAVVGILIAFFGVDLAVVLSGGAMVFYPIFPQLITASIDINSFALFFLGVGTVTFGMLLFIFTGFLTKLFFRGTISYLKWNMDIITK